MWPFKIFKRRKGLYPECLWTVQFDGESFVGADHTGTAMSVRLSDLCKVAIETNDSGPWGADVYWLLFGPNQELNLAFPQGATGEKEVMDRLIELPGFDQDNLREAMGTTSNALFVVWEKSFESQT